MSKPALPILMYHYIGAPANAADETLYISAEQFREQMSCLTENGYTTLSLKEAQGRISGGEIEDENLVLITFDDGHRSFREFAAPILTEFDLRAAMFVITDRVGQPDYLTWAEIEKLDGDRFQFESHGTQHAKLTELPTEEMRSEIFDSKKILESKLGREISWYCYRGGIYNEDVRRTVIEAGYSAAVTCQPGINTHDTDPFVLCRWAVRHSDTPNALLEKLKWTESKPSLLRRVLNKVTI